MELQMKKMVDCLDTKSSKKTHWFVDCKSVQDIVQID